MQRTVGPSLIGRDIGENFRERDFTLRDLGLRFVQGAGEYGHAQHGPQVLSAWRPVLRVPRSTTKSAASPYSSDRRSKSSNQKFAVHASYDVLYSSRWFPASCDAAGLRKTPLNFRAGSFKATGRKRGLQHVFSDKGRHSGRIRNLRVQRLKLFDARTWSRGPVSVVWRLSSSLMPRRSRQAARAVLERTPESRPDRDGDRHAILFQERQLDVGPVFRARIAAREVDFGVAARSVSAIF